jgi:outer membrane immunogenic protein
MMTAARERICANQRDRHAPLVRCFLPAWGRVACGRPRFRHADAARFVAVYSSAAEIRALGGIFYVGGQIGYGSANMNFAGATESLIAFMLRESVLENVQRPSEWHVLGKANPSAASYGGFVGYNVQFSDVIVGLDFHYNGSSLVANAPVSSIDRVVTAGGIEYDVSITGSASMRITDFGSARVRGGWVVSNFLPYATVGFVLGRADVTRSAQVSGTQNPTPVVPCTDPANTCSPFFFSGSDGKKGAFIYGWSAGGGVDVLITPNVFVRGEFEFISFTKIQGIEAQMSTARVGAGVKF